jgi:hypothetical protein
MPQRLSEAERRRYETDGLVFPIRVLSKDESRRYCEACDDLEFRLGGKPRTVEVRQMHLHFRWAYELATYPLVLNAVEDVVGPNLLIWASELFSKHSNDPTVSIKWHRDKVYTGFNGGGAVTAWIALRDSTRANGCMRALPKWIGAGSDEYGPTPVPAHEFDAIDVVLSTGEMSLHDAEILHGSNPNRSDQKRVGFAIRFVTPDTRPLVGRPPAVLVRGSDRVGNFSLIEPLIETDPERALAAMRVSASGHLDAVLSNLKRTEKGIATRKCTAEREPL